MAACFHFLSTPTRGVRAVRGLSPKALCVGEGEAHQIGARLPLSVCELRMRFFERGVRREKRSLREGICEPQCQALRGGFTRVENFVLELSKRDIFCLANCNCLQHLSQHLVERSYLWSQIILTILV